jgi:uncharacterized protein YbbC (DUF1343 family)
MDGTWARELRAADLPGVVFREAYFVPMSSKHAGSTCCGVQLHVTDPETFDPLRTALWMLVTAHRLWPERFGFRDTFELLAGTGRVREAVLAGRAADEIVEDWRPEAQEFREARESVLMY